jgi:catechol 2,3-dioxygenase-like lactoylglutathione lyase family enzyme
VLTHTAVIHAVCIVTYPAAPPCDCQRARGIFVAACHRTGFVRPDGVLETCVYAGDLDAAERFYGGVLGLEAFAREPGRHVFFRCGGAVFLVFDPARTRSAPGQVGGVPIPAHGATGAGHVAFAVPASDLPAWRRRLAERGVPVEAEVAWPRGGHSLYVRDPAGNSVELASRDVWGLPGPPPAA